jgi:glucokinase
MSRASSARGYSAVLSVLEESGRWLEIGLAGFVNIFTPEVIAVEGRALGAGELMLSYVPQEVSARARPAARDLVEIREAPLGPVSGVLGAAVLAKNFSGRYLL